MSVVLLSGGLDSAVCLALAQREGERVVALSIDYGQPHADAELWAARYVANVYGVELVHTTVEIPSASAPGDTSMLWPGRNIVLLALAAALAQMRGLDTVVIGANRDDYDGYPDCRPEFLAAAANALAVNVSAPLVELDKPAIGQLARTLKVPIAQTWSCYYPDHGAACGTCDACVGRARAIG